VSRNAASRGQWWLRDAAFICQTCLPDGPSTLPLLHWSSAGRPAKFVLHSTDRLPDGPPNLSCIAPIVCRTARQFGFCIHSLPDVAHSTSGPSNLYVFIVQIVFDTMHALIVCRTARPLCPHLLECIDRPPLDDSLKVMCSGWLIGESKYDTLKVNELWMPHLFGSSSAGRPERHIPLRWMRVGMIRLR
jgi:hypothetical protein